MEALKACMDAWPINRHLWQNINGILRSLITVEEYTAAFLETFGCDLQDDHVYNANMSAVKVNAFSLADATPS